MTRKTKILIAADAPHTYYYGDFSKMVCPAEIHGLYAYIMYETRDDRIFVLSRFSHFKSYHAGIALSFNTLKNKHSSFFIPERQERMKKFNGQIPAYGGEILFIHGKIIFWNFKSGSYSEMNVACNDANPELKTTVTQSLFPAQCFITITEANLFAQRYIHAAFFEADGQYKNQEQTLRELQQYFKHDKYHFFNHCKTSSVSQDTSHEEEDDVLLVLAP